VSGLPALAAAVTFRVPDPEGRLAGVRLRPEIPVSREDFQRDGDAGWALVIDRPPVNRMEYLLEFRYPDGRTQTGTDTGNPRLAAGAFGEKSVLEFPGYAPPDWLTAPAATGIVYDFERVLDYRLWAPSDAGDAEHLPLLVVHDGPEYDERANLIQYVAAGVARNRLPRMRVALLRPADRNRQYSASVRYADTLQHALDFLPSRPKIGMGTSLGALAMLHTHCRHPRLFDAMFLQSGSYFSPLLDAQERRFPYFWRIAEFVAGAEFTRPVPVALTCGAVEENLPNNRLITERLRARGYPAALHEVPDAHNYTAWRDAFDPHLTRLLQECAGEHSPLWPLRPPGARLPD